MERCKERTKEDDGCYHSNKILLEMKIILKKFLLENTELGGEMTLKVCMIAIARLYAEFAKTFDISKEDIIKMLSHNYDECD